MPKKLFVKKSRLGGSAVLIPAYQEDLEVLKLLNNDMIIEVEFKVKRNPKLHRKFFSLVNMLFENQEGYTNIYDLRRDLTIAAGYYEEKINHFTGEVKLEAKSISFASMDEVEFRQLYKDFITAACKLLKCSNQEFEEALAAYM